MVRDKLKCDDDVVDAVDKYGILPFFSCGIPGFSVEELTPPEYWFVDGVDGPWEWKERLSSSGRCVYGKFFHGRAGYISLGLLPYFINYRRDGYDFDSRCDDGLCTYRQQQLMEIVSTNGAMLSNEIKEKFTGKGFESVLTSLQMQLYLIPVDFEYKLDKKGKRYGWGIGKYAKPEFLFGDDLCRREYTSAPAESFGHIIKVLCNARPDIPVEAFAKLIKNGNL